MLRRKFTMLAAIFGLAGAWPVAAQIDSVDPDSAMQTEWSEEDYYSSGDTTDSGEMADIPEGSEFDPPGQETGIAAEENYSQDSYIPPDTPGNESAETAAPTENANLDEPSTTYQQDDLIAAAGGLFGDGAEGLARMIENILADQGEPNGYIVGREAGGAFIFGLRYGSGTLFHKVEGEQPVYWTGPSVGFDVGANGASTFVLVYNLYDTDELFRRFPAVEGDAYFIGGLTASYLRSGDKVLIPIRLGAGLRLGANLGYMNFSRNRRWLPF